VNGITAKGQTVEEAVQSALVQLGVSRDQVEIRILDKGRKGFLGFLGSRPAIVEVTVNKALDLIEEAVAVKSDPIEEVVSAQKDPIEEAVSYVKGIIREMNLDVTVEKSVKGREVKLTISGEQVALIIGKRGSTLNAIQYLTQLVVNRSTKQYINIMIDAENYREKRRGTLESLAQRLAKQVFNTKKKVILEPMPSFERKVIHQALSHHPHVITTSEGAEPHRHVVISPK
jgi:spoIIIJ-associated protein